ncbi:hypothetical protein TNCV_2634681 [Trichonephila clavipes]|nr:hypothetical protein TNCV_2634681 [Trichonephila clavipes]
MENQLVLLKDPNTKPLDWPMGRILEVFPGSDGLVRVVNVKTSTGEEKVPRHLERSLRSTRDKTVKRREGRERSPALDGEKGKNPALDAERMRGKPWLEWTGRER